MLQSLTTKCILFPIDQTSLVSESTCEPVTSEADPGCGTGGVEKDEEDISPQSDTLLVQTDPAVQHILLDPAVRCVQPDHPQQVWSHCICHQGDHWNCSTGETHS